MKEKKIETCRKLSEETKQKIRLKAIGRKHSEETKEKLRKARANQPSPMKGKKHSQETISLLKSYTGSKNSRFGKKNSEEHKEKIRQSILELYKNLDYKERRITALLKANKNLPNKVEKKMFLYLEKTEPGKWKYVGDGRIIIGGKCPDFINETDKKILEVFGKYWHPESDVKKRKDHFAKFGFSCKIVWDYDINRAKFW